MSSIPSLIVLPLQERGIPAGPNLIIVRLGLNGPIITIGHFLPISTFFSYLPVFLSKFLMVPLLVLCERKSLGKEMAEKMGRGQAVRIGAEGRSGEVLRKLPLPLHEWLSAFGTCIHLP